MEGAMHASATSNGRTQQLCLVALDLETRMEGTTEIMLESCSSRIVGDGEEFSTTEVKSYG